MQFRSLLAVAAGLLTFVAATPIDHDEATYLEESNQFWKRQDPVKPCSTGIHVIAISGEGIANKGSTGDLNTTYAALKAAVPNSTHRNLPYPKGSGNGLGMTTVGASNLIRWLGEYNTECPKTKIVIVGYSSGGIIAMNTLCGASAPWTSPATPLDPKFAKIIIASIIYGDETFVGGQSFDRGSCTGNGRFPRSNSAACAPFARGIHSYCDTADPQCCLGPNGSAHFQYPGLYDNAAVAFVQQRYASTPPL